MRGRIMLIVFIFSFLNISHVNAGNYLYHHRNDHYYTYDYPFQSDKVIKYDETTKEKIVIPIKVVNSNRPFYKSELYYEIQARKWMKELTRKAEESLAKKEDAAQLERYRELKNLSNKQKLYLGSRRRVERVMGKEFLK